LDIAAGSQDRSGHIGFEKSSGRRFQLGSIGNIEMLVSPLRKIMTWCQPKSKKGWFLGVPEAKRLLVKTLLAYG
jgi:hypothetical protein